MIFLMMRAKGLLGPIVKKNNKGKPATPKSVTGAKSAGAKIQQDELNP